MPLAMGVSNHWSVSLASAHGRRPRWLAESGRFTADPRLALRLVSPEVAVRRVQAFMEIQGWSPEVMERFRLVPAPRVQTGMDIQTGMDSLAA